MIISAHKVFILSCFLSAKWSETDFLGVTALEFDLNVTFRLFESRPIMQDKKCNKFVNGSYSLEWFLVWIVLKGALQSGSFSLEQSEVLFSTLDDGHSFLTPGDACWTRLRNRSDLRAS